MFAVVITLDQRRSSEVPDLVPDLVRDLNEIAADDLLMPFQRTIGDECQGVLGSHDKVAEVVARAAIASDWWIGVGVGEVDRIALDTREVSGSAFSRARVMVEDAKRRTRRESGHPRRPWPVRVDGPEPDTNRMLEACLAAIHMIVSMRSDREQQVAGMLELGEHDQQDIAERLGISQPAVSKAIDRSHWDEQRALSETVKLIGRDYP
jgi:hypothetical protein